MKIRLLSGILMLCAASGAHAAAQRLLLKEIVVAPTPAEYVAIFNPGAAAVDLSNYYLADYESYYQLVVGSAPGSSDFIARFPSGAVIAPGETQYVSIGGAECFRSACGSVGTFIGFGVYPNYEIPSGTAANNSATVPDMLAPFAGAIGSTHSFTNGGEPVTLLYWDGVGDLVTDVDYVYFGTPSAGNPAVNKTGIMVNGSTYQPDTPDSASTHAPLSAPGGTTTATCRVDFSETGQIASGGNGVAGADETSEQTATTWQACSVLPDRIFADGFEG